MQASGLLSPVSRAIDLRISLYTRIAVISLP